MFILSPKFTRPYVCHLVILSALCFIMCCASAGIATANDASNRARKKESTSPQKEKSKSATSATASPNLPPKDVAKQLLNHKQTAKCIEILSLVVATKPDDHEALYLRGMAYQQGGQNANALADYNTAIRIDPNQAQYYATRGMFYLVQNHIQRALNDMNQALHLDPSLHKTYNHRGMLYLTLKQTTRAFQDFDKACQLKPDYWEAFNNRGYVYFQNKKYPEALSDFQTILKNQPKFVSSWNNQGLVYFEQKQYARAVESFSEAIKLAPFVLKYYQHRQNTYQEWGKLDEASEDERRIAWLKQLGLLNRQLVRNPRNAKKYLQRGKLWEQSGNFRFAFDDYSRAIHFDKKLISAYRNRAELLFRAERYQDALKECETALAIEDQVEIYSLRGDIYYHQGNYELAIRDYLKVKRIDLDVANAWWKWSQELQKAGKSEEANRARKEALKLNPDIASVAKSNTESNKQPIQQTNFQKSQKP